MKLVQVLDLIFRETDPDRQRKPRWEVLTKMLIGKGHILGPSIIRYRLIQTPYGGLYLHLLLRPDADRDCHDHPWKFTTLVLSGGYLEEFRLNRAAEVGHTSRARMPGSVHTMELESAHRILQTTPDKQTWTLVHVGPRRQDWGFWKHNDRHLRMVDGHLRMVKVPPYFVNWRTYCAPNGNPDPFNS